MKTIYFLLLLSLSCIANTTNKEIAINVNPTNTIETFSDGPIPKNNYISGLKIINDNSRKYGKLIYIVSDIYTTKKISLFNKKGKKVFTISTIGSPIYLSKFKKGTYTIKVVEDGKTEIKEFTIN
ncbi:hypothetical protein [Flavobacterium sp.]|uniref:hypothetical protein n=1 Tax=Flavobacterium sp. TaxID=239 RepID=UPI003752C079